MNEDIFFFVGKIIDICYSECLAFSKSYYLPICFYLICSCWSKIWINMNHTLAIYSFIYYDCLSCFMFGIEIYYTIRLVYNLGKKVSMSITELIFHCHIDNPFFTLSWIFIKLCNLLGMGFIALWAFNCLLNFTISIMIWIQMKWCMKRNKS